MFFFFLPQIQPGVFDYAPKPCPISCLINFDVTQKQSLLLRQMLYNRVLLNDFYNKQMYDKQIRSLYKEQQDEKEF